jgi:hypothetical protein
MTPKESACPRLRLRVRRLRRPGLQQLTQKEVALAKYAVWRTRPEGDYASADKDGDGLITPQELANALRER